VHAVSPTPTPEEAAAIAAAVEWLLEAEAGTGAADAGAPAAYRSPWRRAGILEAVRRPRGPAGAAFDRRAA
jgi:hypothetical protein